MNKRRKTIVHIITGLGLGGAETMLHKLLSSHALAGFDHQVISLGDMGTLGHKLAQAGIAVHCLGMRRGLPTPMAWWRLRRLLRKLQPDLLQGWMYHGNLAASLAGGAVRRKVPVMWNVRQSLYDLRQERWLTRQVIRLSASLSPRVTGIIYNSRNAAHCHERHGFAAARGHILPNGFNTAQFAPDAGLRQQTRNELGISDEQIALGLIGRYHPMKDHACFLRAASLLLARYPQIRLVFAGSGVDEHNAALLRQMQALGLTDVTRLLGERSDMPAVMCALDIAVSSSYNEGFPNVVGEAMSCSVPCVVTDVGDSAWLVGESGRVVPPRDPPALAAALAVLVEGGSVMRTALGWQARARIMSEFSLEAVAAQYANLYRHIMEEAQPCAA